jgi:hypothetical protein
MLGDLKVESTMGFVRSLTQQHVGFLGRSVAFFDIAANTGSHHIFPGIITASGTGHNMIEGEIITAIPTILARVPISV